LNNTDCKNNLNRQNLKFTCNQFFLQLFCDVSCSLQNVLVPDLVTSVKNSGKGVKVKR